MKHTTQKRVSALLLGLIVFAITVRVFALVSSAQFQETNIDTLKEVWTCSQYNLSPEIEFCGNMLDKDIYTYAGLAYLEGEDPIKVNFEHPPLGKYILALGIKSGVTLLTQYLSLLGIGVLTFLLTRTLTKSTLVSLVPVLLVFYDPLIFEYSTFIHLEFLQTLFLMLGLYLLLKPPSSKNGVLLGLAVGGVLATKVLVTGMVFLLFVLLILYVKHKRKLHLQHLVLVTISAGFVYLLSYWRFFMLHNPLEFITLHIRIARFFRAYLPEYPWFEIWRILLLGQWRTWFMEPPIQPVSTFWAVWPIATFISFGATFIKKLQLSQDCYILASWALTYLLYQSTHLVFPNYLIMVLPILYVLMTAALFKAVSTLNLRERSEVGDEKLEWEDRSEKTEVSIKY